MTKEKQVQTVYTIAGVGKILRISTTYFAFFLEDDKLLPENAKKLMIISDNVLTKMGEGEEVDMVWDVEKKPIYMKQQVGNIFHLSRFNGKWAEKYVKTEDRRLKTAFSRPYVYYIYEDMISAISNNIG